MAKKKQDWERAKALYLLGKTTREIAFTTGIPNATIHRRSKKEGWTHGEAKPAVLSGVRFIEDLEQKSGTLRQEVMKEVERVAKVKCNIENITLLALRQLSVLIPKAETTKEVKDAIDAAKTAMVPSGMVSYYQPKESLQNADAVKVPTLAEMYD